MRKLDFKNIDWFSTKPSLERLIVGAAVLAVAGGGYAFSVGGTSPQAQAATPTQMRAGSGPVRLSPVSNQRCRTLAPAGWRISDQNPDGTVFTLKSANGIQTASYAGLAVNSGQVQGFYGPQYRDPRTFTLYAAGLLAGEPARPAGQIEKVGPYEALPFATASHRGWALIYSFRVPADPGGYGLIMRIAIGGQDAKSLGVAGGVAAAAICNAVTHPPTGPVYHAPRETHGAGRSASGGDDATLAGTYNAQLGTGWAHDSLGRNYNVDVTGDWRETGPDGPGFYANVGGSSEKLQGGMS